MSAQELLAAAWLLAVGYFLGRWHQRLKTWRRTNRRVELPPRQPRGRRYAREWRRSMRANRRVTP